MIRKKDDSRKDLPWLLSCVVTVGVYEKIVSPYNILMKVELDLQITRIMGN